MLNFVNWRVWVAAVASVSLQLFTACGGGGGGGDTSCYGEPAVTARTAGDFDRRAFSTKPPLARVNSGASAGRYEYWDGSFTTPASVSVGIVYDGTPNESFAAIPYLKGPESVTYVTPNPDWTEIMFPMGYASALGRSVVSLNFPHANYERSHAGQWDFLTFCEVCDRRSSLWYTYKEAENASLHFNFIFVSADDVDSEQDSHVQKVVSEMGKVFTCNGFQTGEIAYWWLESSDTYVFDIDRNGNGQQDAMDRLFNSYAEDSYYRSQFINVYFVKYIEDGMLGISGGIPGPFYGPTTHSGIVINTYGGLSTHDDEMLTVLGQTVAHEASHYMGLFHTIERKGNTVNSITDIPMCGVENDRNRDGILSADECVDHGAANLMFWAAFGEYQPQWKLTEGQRYVLKRSQFTW